ncbi:MAG: DinB family protein [Ginsengibacter sp.]
MNFTLEKTLEILERTPDVLETLLQNISTNWTSANEGDETWNVFNVVEHLIYGEKTDWIPRLEIILSKSADKTFESFDRFTQFEENNMKSLSQLLKEFKTLRKKNIEHLLAKKISTSHLSETGIHPAFGEVTLLQLLSTWAVHDLNHIAQISRIIANHYKKEVGPWVAYLGILKKRN